VYRYLAMDDLTVEKIIEIHDKVIKITKARQVCFQRERSIIWFTACTKKKREPEELECSRQHNRKRAQAT
jgi:hypothetical protein